MNYNNIIDKDREDDLEIRTADIDAFLAPLLENRTWRKP